MPDHIWLGGAGDGESCGETRDERRGAGSPTHRSTIRHMCIESIVVPASKPPGERERVRAVCFYVWRVPPRVPPCGGCGLWTCGESRELRSARTMAGSSCTSSD